MADRRDKRLLAPIGLGVEFAAVMGVSVVLGQWVDRHFDTAPWALVIGASIGLLGGLYRFLKSAQRAWRQVEGGGPAPRSDTDAPRSDTDRAERNDAD